MLQLNSQMQMQFIIDPLFESLVNFDASGAEEIPVLPSSSSYNAPMRSLHDSIHVLASHIVTELIKHIVR